MSRVGKLPVSIPSGVSVNIDGNNVTVSGPKGKLDHCFPAEVSISTSDNNIIVSPLSKNDRSRAMWGLSRTLINNMVEGVSKGFVVQLDVNGVGYRASSDKGILTLFLGFSHEIKYIIPEGVEIKTPKPTEVEIHGFDKKLVGQIAAEIRSLRKPEPYKGKGVKYRNEVVRRKEGKKK